MFSSCGHLDFTHPVHHFDTWVPLFRAHKSFLPVASRPPASRPIQPCRSRSDSFCLASGSGLSISLQRKGFRSQVKQMSGDDRIRARRPRNFVARTDADADAADTDMTRARRGQQRARSLAGWLAATGPERVTERGRQGERTDREQKQNFNVTSHSDSDKLIGCPAALPSIPQTDSAATDTLRGCHSWS